MGCTRIKKCSGIWSCFYLGLDSNYCLWRKAGSGTWIACEQSIIDRFGLALRLSCPPKLVAVLLHLDCFLTHLNLFRSKVLGHLRLLQSLLQGHSSQALQWFSLQAWALILKRINWISFANFRPKLHLFCWSPFKESRSEIQLLEMSWYCCQTFPHVCFHQTPNFSFLRGDHFQSSFSVLLFQSRWSPSWSCCSVLYLFWLLCFSSEVKLALETA